MHKKVHIVPHVHWDREWYFSDEESKVLLMDDMEDILTMLENNEDYPFFVLDGQTSILEDYLSVMPQNKKRIKKLVEKGKLIIGPWYTQTDELVVGGESIVRNLLYGFKDCKEYNSVMKIGYLPDSFGQSSSMPKILNGFDIKRCMFWRGISERMGTDKTEFVWKDNNDNSVTVQLLPLGYAIGKYLPTDEIELKKRMEKYFPVLDKGATSEHVLLPNGHDQMPIQKNIFNVIDILSKLYPKREFFLSKYENIFDEIEKNNLPVIKGEFLDGKYMRVHRSIFSSRADIKSYNTRIENKFTNILEPLASIAYSLGFPYYSGMIEETWKTILKNHAHDSIGCCCSDKVHSIIKKRFFVAEEKIDMLINYYMRKITDAMDSNISLDKLTVFNLLPYTRNNVVKAQIITKMKSFILTDESGREINFEITHKEIVDAGLIDRQIVHYGDYEPFVRYYLEFIDTIPSMGYKAYFINKSEKIKELSTKNSSDNFIENEFFKIVVNHDGTLNILDKINDIEYLDILAIEDGSDDGDEYDYSPLEDDFIVTSKGGSADISVTKTAFTQKMSINIKMNIPKDIESRKSKKCDGLFRTTIDVEIEESSPFIKLLIDIENNCEDHRIRVLIPINLAVNASISDNQFGIIKRSAKDSAINEWEKEKWTERPDAIYPFLTYVTTDADKSLAIVTNSVREYEIIGDNLDIIAITIFRSTGFLGKEDLIRRPGRPSGIKMPTPDSQMKGKFKFDLALFAKTSCMAKLAKEYLTRFVSYNKMPYNAMKINSVEFNTPFEYSFFNDLSSKAILSAVKKSEYNDGIIVRYFNAMDEEVSIELETEFDNVYIANLNEDLLEKIKFEDKININTNQVISFNLSKE